MVHAIRHGVKEGNEWQPDVDISDLANYQEFMVGVKPRLKKSTACCRTGLVRVTPVVAARRVFCDEPLKTISR